MPNIEIHGLSASNSNITVFDIRRALFSLPMAKDIVLTSCNDNVINLVGGECQPFLRVIVVGSNAMENQQILSYLKPLGFDIELMIINSFIPKE